MSAALLRQALEFVDPDENSGKRNKKRGGRRVKTPGQELAQKSKSKVCKQKLKEKQVSEEVVHRLLKLSQPAVDVNSADKIVKRACTGKPVCDEIKIVKHEEQKSILFPDEEEDFKQIEEE